MQTKAKLEVEIAALAEEVRELARRRGRALPTVADWVDWLQALAATPDDLRAAADRVDNGEGEEAVFSGFVTRAEVTPAAEPVKEALLAAVVTAAREERPAYFQALRALRARLADLLAQRAEKWSQEWRGRLRSLDLYRGAYRWSLGAPTPRSLAEEILESAARAKGWEVAVLAGLAVRCAADELTAWREWVTGGAAERHASLTQERASASRSSSDDPAAQWARDVASHALPDEEEIELVGRGVVSAEELAAVKALPPVPPSEERGAYRAPAGAAS